MKQKPITFITLIIIAVLVIVAMPRQLARAVPAARPLLQSGAPQVVSYQGQVTVDGAAYNGAGYFKFAVVNAAGDITYWANDGTAAGEPATAVQLSVVNGLFNVLLGDTAVPHMTALPAAAFDGTERYLRVWFSSEGSTFTLLSPDRRIAAVPYALQAEEALHAATAGDADTVDGQHASAFASSAHNHDATYVNEGQVNSITSAMITNGTLAFADVGQNGCASGQVMQWNGAAWACASGAGSSWSLTGNAGTAAGTNFLGTTDNQALEVKVNNARALRLEPGASPNLIGGYSGNWVGPGVYGAVIGGGGNSGDLNRVFDSMGVIGGGRNNQAGTDDGVHYSMLATVAGGANNTASGFASTISGGWGNTASGMYATVPGGQNASATHFGEMAYASGAFSQFGDAQTSIYVLKGQLSEPAGTWSELFLDGASATQRLTIADGRTLTFDILVVGRATTGESAGYQIRGVVENVAGYTFQIGTPTITVLGEDDSAWDVRAWGNPLHDALVIEVRGNGEQIRWVARVSSVEASW